MFVVLGSIVLTLRPNGSRRVLGGRGTRFRGEVRWGSGTGPPASGCSIPLPRRGSSGGERSSSGTICGMIGRLPCCDGLGCCICGRDFAGGVGLDSGDRLFRDIVGTVGWQGCSEGRPFRLYWRMWRWVEGCCGFQCGPMSYTGWIFGRFGSFRSTERCGDSRDVGCCGSGVGRPPGDSGI
jgi:hypothetical protein